MKNILTVTCLVLSTGLFALTDLENLMIKEATTPEGKTAAKTYLTNVAKEKESASKHHEEQAGVAGSAGKAVLEASSKKNHLKLAKELKNEAQEYRKAAEAIK